MENNQCIPLRRIGSSVIHLVEITPESLGVGHFVSDFLGTEAPLTSLCMANLKGTKVWMKNGKVCAKCSSFAESNEQEIIYYE